MDEKKTELKYSLKNIKDTPWYNGKGHSPNAISKKLVGVANGTNNLGYVISCYAPGHYMEPHVHKIRHQVYHILEGEGVLVIDGERHHVGKGDVAYFPPGVWHGLYNESTENVVFVIASAPAEE